MGRDRDKEALEAFMAYYRSCASSLKKHKKELNRRLAKDPNPLIRTFRSDLADLNDGGKNLRGVLVELGYRLGGGKDPEHAMDLALAFEMFQTAVLVHDDIIDNADMRRGKMTIQNRYEDRLEVRDIRILSAQETEPALCNYRRV